MRVWYSSHSIVGDVDVLGLGFDLGFDCGAGFRGAGRADDA